MSEAIAFDTHRYVKKLTRSGFTEEQAEALAEEQVAMLNANLATKADIAAIKAGMDALRQETKADIAKSEAGLKAEIAKSEAGLKAEIAKSEARLKAEIAKIDKRIETVKADLLKWMFGGLVAQGGVVVALLQLFK